MQEKIKNIANELFEKMSLEIESIEISNPEGKIFDIKIKSPDSPIIIGHSGETLHDIKNILSLLINKNLEDKFIIHIEINDYMESKDKRLFDFVQSKIDFVEKTGREYVLPFFSAYERKKIHSYFSTISNKKISLKSIGEGKDRKMHITKNDIKLSIDLDGNDI